MSLQKKDNNLVKNIIGDFSGIQWKDLDHKKVFAAIAVLIAIIAVVVVLIVKAVSGGTGEEAAEGENKGVFAEVVEEAVDENPLEVDAYQEVNDLVFKYFYGRCMGDIDMLREVVDQITDEEIQTIERKKDYIEAYRHLTYYTKKGMEEGSYVVFASYEMKIYDIETLAPGIEALYVCTNEDGELYIFNGDASEELTNYVLSLAAEEEVAAVIADVDARYQQLVAEDDELGKFAQAMLEAQQAQEEIDVAAEQEAEAGETAESGELAEGLVTTVNDGIRIREAHSTESRIIAVIVSGTQIKIYANYEDGWSKIEYSGTVGFCKTEYVNMVDGVPMLEVEEVEEEPEEEVAEEPEEVTSTDVNKKMKLTDAVRIRESHTTDSDILARAYKNEIVTVLENCSNGWSKVKYNDVTGYCMTQYLTEAN